jgi:hypothetical protein
MIAGGTGTASGLNSYTIGGAFLFLAGLVLMGVTLLTVGMVVLVSWLRGRKG